MIIQNNGYLKGTRLPLPKGNSHLSEYAALFALDISDNSQVRNSLIAAGTLLKEWLIDENRPLKSTVMPEICPANDTAALTALNILKALDGLARKTSTKPRAIESVVTEELGGLLPSIIDLLDRAALKAPETLPARPGCLEDVAGSARDELRSIIVRLSSQDKTLLTSYVARLLDIAKDRASDASLS